MEIEFGVGAYGIMLGMGPEDVIRVLGMPDKINIDEDDEIYEQMFIYNKHMLTVWFERGKKLRATLIQCYSPDATVFGEKVMSKNKKQIKAFMKKNGFGTCEEIDDYSEEVLFYEDISAWFNFMFDQLTYIEFTMLTSDDDVFWPYNGDLTADQ